MLETAVLYSHATAHTPLGSATEFATWEMAQNVSAEYNKHLSIFFNVFVYLFCNSSSAREVFNAPSPCACSFSAVVKAERKARIPLQQQFPPQHARWYVLSCISQDGETTFARLGFRTCQPRTEWGFQIDSEGGFISEQAPVGDDGFCTAVGRVLQEPRPPCPSGRTVNLKRSAVVVIVVMVRVSTLVLTAPVSEKSQKAGTQNGAFGKTRTGFHFRNALQSFFFLYYERDVYSNWFKKKREKKKCACKLRDFVVSRFWSSFFFLAEKKSNLTVSNIQWPP